MEDYENKLTIEISANEWNEIEMSIRKICKISFYKIP